MNGVEEAGKLGYLVQLAGQRAGEIEAKAVDVHFGDPVAQRIHHQLEHLRVHYVQ